MLKHYHFFLFVLFLGTTTTLSAQITLTAENYGVQDSVFLSDTLYFQGGFTPDIPTGGENQTWDYSAIQADSIFIFSYERVAEEDTCFVGAQTRNSLDISFQAFNYTGFGYTSYEEGGRFNVGSKTDGAKFPLTAITGNPMDTLAILPRVIRAKEALIRFPSTYGTISVDSTTLISSLELTVGNFGLNRTPGAQILTRERTVEVIGYGDLILPGLTGAPSEPLEALLVKTTVVGVSTYTLGGAPAPAELLQVFGVSQNDTEILESYHFQVKGMGRSAARVISRDGGLNYKFEFRRVPAGLTTGVNNVSSLEPLQFSPNPVRPGEILRLSSPTGVIGGILRLLDLQGRTITESTFSTLPGDNIEFRLPAIVKPGLYIQQVFNQSGRLVGVGKVVVR